MNNQEIKRRLEIVKLATRYYQSLLDENPIAVQFKNVYEWRDSERPTFKMALAWREKPAEPKIIYRWTDKNGNTWHSRSDTFDETNANVVERYVQDIDWTAPS